MKGLPGIVIAAGLGILGAFCNWFYIENQARNYESVAFVAVSEDAAIKAGDQFREEHFVRVDVPKKFVGELDKTAVHWKDRQLATVYRATKSYRGDEVLFEHDLTGVAQQDLTERLGKGEVLFPVVVDSSTFIPEHYDPGDEVEFFIPQILELATSPTGTPPPEATSSTKTVGKFRILALGGRKGKRDTAKAYNQRPVRENIVTIALKFPFDAQAEQLFQLIAVGGGRGVRMIKHKPAEAGK
jgi:hypothetical protein